MVDKTKLITLQLLNRRFCLGIWTVKAVLNPISGQGFGMTRVGCFFLLSGMTAIGWSMESGRRGYGASGWKIFRVFGLTESLEAAL
ncbi:hypothetical protein TNCV_2874611 [Trichonephila clavipes]|nr:hypothetical protein TNCV_2874611 [Trichonephila clavipes]